MPGGNTARSARRCCGPYVAAGNSFSWLAPTATARRASVAVAKPGMTCRFSRNAWPITGSSQFGATMRRPPAWCVRPTCSTLRTVPAPMTQSCRSQAARAAMLAKGSGELRGTSIMRIPASYTMLAVSTTRAGVTPRRIAISGTAAEVSVLIGHRFRCMSIHLPEPGERCRNTVDRVRSATPCGESGGVELRQLR